MSKLRRAAVVTQWGRVSGFVYDYELAPSPRNPKGATKWGFKIKGPAAMTTTGKPYQEHKAGFPSQKEALGRLDGRLQNIREGHVYVGVTSTVQDLFDSWQAWLKEQGNVERASDYRQVFKDYILPWFKDRSVTDVAPRLDGHYAHLLKMGGHMSCRPRPHDPSKCKEGRSLKPNTVLKVDAALRSMFTYATKRLRVFGVSPLSNVARPAVAEERELTTWSAPLIHRALEMLAKEHMRIAYAVVLLTGMRPGEVTGLRWSQIDWEAKTINVNNQITSVPGMGVVEKPPKWSSRRTVSIGVGLHQMLLDHQKTQKEAGEKYGWTTDYVLCKPVDGKPYTRTAVSARWGRALERHKLPKIPLHGARHSFATVIKDAGVSLNHVGEVLGHRPGSKATAIYVRATPIGAQVAADAMDAALKGAA